MKTLKESINESLKLPLVRHDKKNERFEAAGGFLQYSDFSVIEEADPDDIEIQILHVTNRRLGIGTELVKACLLWAKEIKRNLILCASPLVGEMSEKQLIEYYTSLGFKVVKKNILKYYVK